MGTVHNSSGSASEKGDTFSYAASNSSQDAEGQVGTVEGLQSGLKSRHAQMIALGKQPNTVTF